MIHTVQLDIEPDDLADAAFTVASFDRGQDEATHTGWVELPEDSLGADNKRYFTLQSLRSIKVHAVSDKPRTQNPNQNLHGQTIETFFMKRALTAGSDAVPIDFTESSSVPGATTLNRTDVLILANVAQLSSNEAQRVAAYVASGGGLIVTVGDNIDADVYEQRLGGEIGLMPCNFVRPVGDAFDRQQFRVLATVKLRTPDFRSVQRTEPWRFW